MGKYVIGGAAALAVITIGEIAIGGGPIYETVRAIGSIALLLWAWGGLPL